MKNLTLILFLLLGTLVTHATLTNLTYVTLTNPAPATAGDLFGSSIAGNDIWLCVVAVGKTFNYTNGVAYIYTNAVLEVCITNPVVFNSGGLSGFNNAFAFGSPNAASLAPDYAGKVYAYLTNGAPAGSFEDLNCDSVNFGSAIASAGTNGIIVGASGDFDAATCSLETGTAYYYSQIGTTNVVALVDPNNGDQDEFGFAVGRINYDKFIVGAPGCEKAFIFNLAGTNLVTITGMNGGNATNTSVTFGDVVQEWGAGGSATNVVISDSDFNQHTGQFYLYSTNGALWKTITNPAPTIFSYFGVSISGVVNGTNYIVGAWGQAYIYNADGTLNTTITNPGTADTFFGRAVTAVGANTFAVADEGAGTGGLVYYYTIGSGGGTTNSVTSKSLPLPMFFAP